MLQLTEALNQSGLTKNNLADLLGVSRQTVYRMGGSISDDVAEVIAKHNKTVVANDIPVVAINTRKEPATYADADLLPLLKRRGQGECDYDIAHSVGLKVHEFNKIIYDYATARLNAKLRDAHSSS